MSLKAELQAWGDALKAYDSENFETAIARFEPIAESSKILFNLGLINATLGEHQRAIAYFNQATALDQYFAVAYHQTGVSHFLIARYDDALASFEEALLYMRGNQTINYEQLGLAFRLFSAEIYFNIGLTKIYLGHVDSGMADLLEAQKEKQVPEHQVIDDAIRDTGRDYTVFSIPVGVLFRPAASKLKNLDTKDYMGKARLIAASDASDAFTTFTGITRLQRGQTPTGGPLDASQIKRSASVSALDAPSHPIAPSRAHLTRSNTVAAPRAVIAPLKTHSRSTSGASPPRPPPPPPHKTLSHSPESDYQSVSQRPAPRLDVHIGQQSPTLQTPQGGGGEGRLKFSRVTELYDDYYAPDDDLPDLPPVGGRANALGLVGTGSTRIGSWANKTPPQARGLSRSTSANANAGGPPSSFGGSQIRRLVSARVAASQPRRTPSVSIRSSRFESEAGYASDEYEIESFEMTKIRVKVRIGETTRGMALTPEMNYEQFMLALKVKFASQPLTVQFKDEDGDMLEMHDDSDYEAAVDVARANANGRPEGKLEIWVG